MSTSARPNELSGNSLSANMFSLWHDKPIMVSFKFFSDLGALIKMYDGVL